MRDWYTPDYKAAMDAEYEAIRAKHPSLVTVPFECYHGWYGIIGEYFDTVARLMEEHPGSTYELRQVKEKLAGLRLYARSSDDIAPAVREAYDRAAGLSDRTCEACGRPAIIRVRGGWYATRCDDHADGGVPVPPEGTQ